MAQSAGVRQAHSQEVAPTSGTTGRQGGAPAPTRLRITPVDLYVVAGVAAGLSVIAVAVRSMPPLAGWSQWLLISALAWLSAPLALRIPGAHLTITVSESLCFIVAIAFGWQPAVLTVAVDGLLTSLRLKSVRLHRTAFNVAEPALSMAACGLVLDWLSGLTPAQRVDAPLIQLLVPGFAATTTYLLSNSALQSGAVALESRASALATWRRHVGWLIVDHMGGTSLALLVVASVRGPDPVGLFAAVPLLGTLYVAYRTSIKQAEKALSFAERLNSLYLGTVESLATAIDAKDQVTHGHITRVRTLAQRIAGVLGLREDSTIRALEAGALLHDVGKLGVPDHILNKPGPLTPGEYEQVKRHAAIGADIVSRVAYPYPVAPIVRHHHENWDGSGYPDGLRGTDIPVGARILSVIDCYDALTSDRPYRRAMSHEDALDIVIARAGTMYDPAVVDALVALRLDLDPPRAAEPAAEGLRDTRESLGGHGTAATPAEPGHTAGASGQPSPPREGVLRLAAQLLQMTPAHSAALFLPANSGAALYVAWTEGVAAADIAGLRPGMGRGLSGWVAAHRATLINARGDLEFQAGTRPPHAPRYALSTPVDLDGGATGAFTLYSDDAPFDQAHRELAHAVAHALGRCARGGGSACAESSAGRPAAGAVGEPESAILEIADRVAS